MAEPELVFVQGDTGPDIAAVLHVQGNTSTVIDLTGATVRFQMRKPDDRKFTVDAPATIQDADAGDVVYQWSPNDLAVEGDYHVQWEITFSNGRVQTTATPGLIRVRRQ
jgi:hypothetical protein